MSAHTPGPWHVNGSNIHARWTDPDGNATDRWIATVSAGQGDKPHMTDYTNSRLIAAAPALLKALKALLREAGTRYSRSTEQARAAIAQARGQG